MFEEFRALACGLPEDIAALIGKGDYEDAKVMIDLRLLQEPPRFLRDKLIMTREFLPRLAREYGLTREEAIRQLKTRAPGGTDGEFDALEREGWLDFRCINGEKRYFRRCVNTLIHTHEGIAARAGRPLKTESELLDPMIARMKKNGAARLRFKVEETLKIDDGAFVPGETYRVHMPLPAAVMQQSDIRLLDCSPTPAHVAREKANQRTVYFEEKMQENAPFRASFAYTQEARYTDFTASVPTYPDAPAPTRQDLSEWGPHILFTPYLRDLAEELRGGEVLPLRVARNFYNFITQKVRYSFVRSYLLIEGGAEHTAVNLKGDCGLQALLFIALCRIAGIPARWQSGWCMEPDDIGSHDWALFHVEPYGWLPCDPSFGGSAFRRGARERWDFYFGNLDPYRMAANSAYMQAFEPPKLFLPADPYDNQSGEVETPSRGLNAWEYDMEIKAKEEAL